MYCIGAQKFGSEVKQSIIVSVTTESKVKPYKHASNAAASTATFGIRSADGFSCNTSNFEVGMKRWSLSTNFLDNCGEFHLNSMSQT